MIAGNDSEIFDSVSAKVIIKAWERLAAGGHSPAEISFALSEPNGYGVTQFDIDPQMIFPLVRLQIAADHLDRDLLDQALEMISNEAESDRWEDPKRCRDDLKQLKQEIEAFEADRDGLHLRQTLIEPDQILY